MAAFDSAASDVTMWMLIGRQTWTDLDSLEFDWRPMVPSLKVGTEFYCFDWMLKVRTFACRLDDTQIREAFHIFLPILTQDPRTTHFGHILLVKNQVNETNALPCNMNQFNYKYLPYLNL